MYPVLFLTWTYLSPSKEGPEYYILRLLDYFKDLNSHFVQCLNAQLGEEGFMKLPKHSRLAFLSDKGGKTRVVALGDIFSQSVLKPIHNHLERILKKLSKVDGTFDQDKQRLRIKAVTMMSKRCYSFDMSSCTDRFPAIFQMLII